MYEFCNKDINKFMLLLRKGIYPCEYMDSWERFEEVLVPDKKHFYSELTMEGIIDSEHRHAKRVFRSFGNKNLGNYHDLYVKSYTLLLADVFENFRDQCIEIYDPYSAHFLRAPGPAWQASLQISGVKLELTTDVDMLSMVERGIRGGICQTVTRNVKVTKKYMGDDYDDEMDSSYP